MHDASASRQRHRQALRRWRQRLATPRAQPIVFRLFPETGTRCKTLYVHVSVWPDRRALHDAKRREGLPLTRGCDGCCAGVLVRWYNHGRVWTRPIVAEVHLHRERLTMEVVTHEFFHAALAWGRRIHFDWTRLDGRVAINHDEERLAYVHGRLCRDFVTRATDAGLYP